MDCSHTGWTARLFAGAGTHCRYFLWLSLFLVPNVPPSCPSALQARGWGMISGRRDHPVIKTAAGLISLPITRVLRGVLKLNRCHCYLTKEGQQLNKLVSCFITTKSRPSNVAWLDTGDIGLSKQVCIHVEGKKVFHLCLKHKKFRSQKFLEQQWKPKMLQ